MKVVSATFGVSLMHTWPSGGCAPHCSPTVDSAPAGGWKTTMSPTEGSLKRWPMRLTSTRCPIASVGSIDALGMRYGLTRNAWMSSASPIATTTIVTSSTNEPRPESDFLVGLAMRLILLRPAAALLEAPLAHVFVMAREQHLRDLPAAPLRRPGVVRVLRAALERGGEGLLGRRLVLAEYARQLAQDRVADDHRGELSARQHVAADRQLLGGEVLDDPLVEALVAAAQQGECGLGGELVDQRVVEQPSGRRQRDHAPLLGQLHRVDPVAGAQGGLQDVHAQDHARAPAERRVVDLPPLQRRGGPHVDRLDGVPGGERVGHVALAAEPLEPVGEEREHVDVHGAPTNSMSTSMRRVSRSMVRIASCTIGTSSSPPSTRSTSSASHEGSAIIRRTTPTSRVPSTTAQPSSSCGQYSSSSSGASASSTHSVAPRSASASGREEQPSTRRIGRSGVPARRSTSRGTPATSIVWAAAISSGTARVTWNEPSSPCGRPTR